MVLAAYQAERQATWRDHRPPLLWLGNKPGTEPDKALNLSLIGDLDVEVDARPMIAHLLMDVGITITGLKATELWMSRPGIPKLPPKCR
jgi:hypothetical protein